MLSMATWQLPGVAGAGGLCLSSCSHCWSRYWNRMPHNAAWKAARMWFSLEPAVGDHACREIYAGPLSSEHLALPDDITLHLYKWFNCKKLISLRWWHKGMPCRRPWVLWLLPYFRLGTCAVWNAQDPLRVLGGLSFRVGLEGCRVQLPLDVKSPSVPSLMGWASLH